MKKGKNVKLNLYSPIKTTYGTVDSKDLKSIYINIQSWVTPKIEDGNWRRIVNCLLRDIKISISDSLDKKIFNEKTIVDLDLRTSGIHYGKKSFLNLEMNLYTLEKLDFRDQKIKDCVKKTIRTIYKNDIITNEYFDFYCCKTEYQNKL
jgi:hypothetical protein